MSHLQDVLRIGAVAVGVDVGTRAIKVVEARRTAKGLELSRYGIAPTPSGAVENGLILDPAGAAAAITGVLRTAGIQRRRVTASVSGQNVLARILRLPPIPEAEVKQALRWEAGRHLPFPVEEAVLDAQVVREVTDDGQRQIEVLLAAAPEALVLTYVEMLTAARLEIAAIEVSALAMVRALTLRALPGTVAMVNLGASTSEVAIVRDGVPQFTRTIPEGVEKVELDTVTVQLRRSFDFYQAQYGVSRIDRILLCGGGARTRGVERHFAQEMEVPVSVATPLDVIPLSGQLDAAQTGGLAPQLVTATGLALRMIA